MDKQITNKQKEIELINKKIEEVNISENEKTKKLKAIFIPREYLYLHFPDGYKFSLDLSFLKRVRAEMDFFLKEFKTDLTLLDD